VSAEAVAAAAVAPRAGRALARRALAYAPALAASGALGALAIRAILAAAGRPALPLDDAFIHLQYAKRLAEGAFYSYVPGEGYSTGATSPLWPLLLAPFHALGVRGLSLVWVAWLLGTLAHAATAVETTRLASRLAGRAAAVGAGAMCLAFGAFAWFAWSGMETMALAWVLLRTARVGAEWLEAKDGAPAASERARVELVALGVLAPLVRPEGAIASLVAATALALRPRSPRARLFALAPLVGPLVVPLVNLALAGHAASATAQVKWLALSPYASAAELRAAVVANAAMLSGNILDGGEWTWIFLPQGAAPVLLAGLVALVAGLRRAPARAAFTLAIALGALVPCTYASFLWNRLRYVWPFLPAFFIGAACLAREIGSLARLARARLAFVTPLVVGLFVGALATKLPSSLRDLAQSARAIDGQQVALGRWAAEHLPPDARIGVNDTGAIAYVGGRRTFDVVGLTTEGEARYWAAGSGSRFEHYERLPRERLPTHFMVYPHWMSCAPVLGRELTEATVLDQTILGGATMIAYEARWDALGSGALPLLDPPAGRLVDELDVADLESEAAHAYALGGARDVDDRAVWLDPPEGSTAPRIAEGGRFLRPFDRFVAHLEAGRGARLVMRVAADEPTPLVVRSGARELGRVDVPPDAWVERHVTLPADATGPAMPLAITPATEGTFASFHYWLYADD
jgi:hypothetical protein